MNSLLNKIKNKFVIIKWIEVKSLVQQPFTKNTLFRNRQI